MASVNKRAVLSGVLGATASLVGKLALSPDSPAPSAVRACCASALGGSDEGGGAPPAVAVGGELLAARVCPALALATRAVCLLGMIGVNAGMISSFVEGMEESGSVAGTALSTAANFSCSAMYGMIFFGEVVPPSWYFGAALIAAGMWLLSSVTLVDAPAKDD